MIRIHINGEERAVEAECTLAGLLEALGLAGKRIAVELNEDVVPASGHAGVRVTAGDRIEIVHAIGGG